MTKDKEKDKDDVVQIAKELENLGCKVVSDLKEIDSPYHLPCGLFSLDIILSEKEGFGGGKCVEIFGQEGAGKSSLALLVLGKAQKMGYPCFYINMERSVTSSLVKCFPDIDPLKVKWIEPEHGQAAFNAVELICRTQKNPFIVLDSIPACISSSQMEEGAEKEFYSPIARMLSTSMPKIKRFVGESGALVVFLNQLRDNVSGYGEKEKVPGGRAIKFYCDVRLRLRVKEKILSGEDVIGHRVEATTIKTRDISPYRKALFPLYYGKGFDVGGELLEMALQFGMVKKTGSWLEFDGQKKQGEMQMGAYIAQNPEAQGKIKDMVRKMMK